MHVAAHQGDGSIHLVQRPVRGRVGPQPVAEAGADTNADGCSRTATDLVIGAPALSTVAIGPGNAVTVRFQVTIN